MSGRRLPIVVLLVGLLVAAIVAGDRTVRAPAGVREASVAAAMPAAVVRSSAWYCSGGPVGTGPSADQVTISNVGAAAVRVAIDTMRAHQVSASVPEQLVTIAPRSSRTFAVAKLSKSPSAAVVVQPLGGDVVVEQGFSVGGDLAMAPCATRAASDWYFAAGSSVGGAETTLSLLDPFAVDAVVDIEAYTENGFRAPGSLQGLVVAQQSRLAVRVDQAVAQQRIVAIGVHVRNGSRVVATESVIRSRSGGGTSASLSLGSPAAQRTWMFADDRSRSGADQQLVIADPGDTDATATVTIVADVAAVIEPRTVRIPATSAVAVDFSNVVPAGVSYTLSVHSAIPVVAETRIAYPSGADFAGLVTELGSSAAAPRWSFAGGPFTATGLGGGQPRVPAGYDLEVVMAVHATANEIAHVRGALSRDGHVRSFHFVSRAEAWRRLTTAARDNPALLQGVTPASVPEAFDVVAKGPQSAFTVRRRVGARPGVQTVLAAAGQGPVVFDDVIVLNPGSRPLRVTVVATAGGSTMTGIGLRDVLVGSGREVMISLAALTRQGAAVVVNAGGPVVAERFVAGPSGVTRAPGVPGS